MVKTARACCSLALLACTSSSSPRVTTAFVVGGSRHYPRAAAAALISTSRRSIAAMSASTEIAEVDVASNLESVRQRMQDISRDDAEKEVRLVAVSKTKPVPMLMQAYDAGQRVFGENYAQELVGKASELPSDIEWHFIGPLQSNKANLLVKNVPNLCVETVASLKLANKLNRAVEQKQQQQQEEETGSSTLGIFVQVNTSGEDTKSGVAPGQDTITLCQEIVKSCPLLTLKGLMTIGAPGDTSCFDLLVKCRDEVAGALDMPELEVSMGMSGDFEQAIQHGATSVRVGSTIFGERDYSNLKK